MGQINRGSGKQNFDMENTEQERQKKICVDNLIFWHQIILEGILNSLTD